MRVRITVAVVAIALIAVTVLLGWQHDSGRERTTAEPVDDPRPNVVFILMDDFSLDLLPLMSTAHQMRRNGASYENSFVVDSLCCPSRAALLTGQTPHQTGVLTNTPNVMAEPIGGYEAFVRHGNLPKQFSVALQDSGYTTGFIGKYINGYQPTSTDDAKPGKVPGWTEWRAFDKGGYNGWGFGTTHLDEDGEVQVTEHPVPPLSAPEAERDRHFATNVMSDMALDFIERHDDDAAPYFLEVAPFTPHSRLKRVYPRSPGFPAAFADQPDRGDRTGGNCGPQECGDLLLSDMDGFDDPRDDVSPTYLRADGTTRRAPSWRHTRDTMTRRASLGRYRQRARAVQSIDRLVARVRQAVGPNTYVFLTSDNGYHLAQHRIGGGKGTPYDTDTRVPLLVEGPGVRPGPRHQFVNNIDLASTFEALAGLKSPAYRSGTSFLPSLKDRRSKGGRYAFFEHTWARSQPGEVDHDKVAGGLLQTIPSFIAVRGKRGLLVRFDLDKSWRGVDHAWELYRYNVAWEDRNVFARDHDKPWARDLMRRLVRFDGCAPRRCRALTR